MRLQTSAQDAGRNAKPGIRTHTYGQDGDGQEGIQPESTETGFRLITSSRWRSPTTGKPARSSLS